MRARRRWSGRPRARGGTAGARSGAGASGATQEQEWSPRLGGAGVGGAGARGGAVGMELRRTRLVHVQVRHDKAGASAVSATGGGE
jgi:hypothetical protein